MAKFDIDPRHDLTNKKTLPKTKKITKRNAMTKTFREHLPENQMYPQLPQDVGKL